MPNDHSICRRSQSPPHLLVNMLFLSFLIHVKPCHRISPICFHRSQHLLSDALQAATALLLLLLPVLLLVCLNFSRQSSLIFILCRWSDVNWSGNLPPGSNIGLHHLARKGDRRYNCAAACFSTRLMQMLTTAAGPPAAAARPQLAWLPTLPLLPAQGSLHCCHAHPALLHWTTLFVLNLT